MQLIYPQRFSRNAQMARLRTAVAENERTSDNCANQFLEGQMEDDDFVRQYKEARKAFHRRALLAEKSQNVQWGDVLVLQ